VNASRKLTITAAVVAAVILIIGGTVAVTMTLMSSPSKVVYIAPASPAPPAPAPKVEQARADLAVGGVAVAARNSPPGFAPFSDLRWRGTDAQVRVNGAWFNLVAVNHVKAADLFEFAQRNYGDSWHTLIATNLTALMARMNAPIGKTVTLDLTRLGTGEPVILNDVAMVRLNPRSARQLVAGSAPGSPFAGLRWRDEMPVVQVNGVWYDLIAINNVPAQEIVQFAKDSYGFNDMGGQPFWQKRFGEDLEQVMGRMRHPIAQTVDLQLRDSMTGQIIRLDKVERTAENRTAIVDKGTRVSPFRAVRWTNDLPEVQMNDQWYGLVTVDEVPIEKIVEFAKQTYGSEVRGGQPAWQARVTLSLGPTMSQMGFALGTTVDLTLRDLKTSEVVTRNKAEMTQDNLVSVFTSRSDASPR